MYFTDLQYSLLEILKARIRNGELTERGLARLVGVSQPHMHNVLKGARFLSPNLADQILRHLHMSAVDLMNREGVARHVPPEQPSASEYTHVPMLDGTLGPGHSWPSRVHSHNRFALLTEQLGQMIGPVVVQLAGDIRMQGVFEAGDFALLDQSLHARTTIEAGALYVVKRGNTGVLRRLRTSGRNIFIVAEDSLEHTAAWEQIHLEDQFVQYVVRARAMLVAREIEWTV